MKGFELLQTLLMSWKKPYHGQLFSLLAQFGVSLKVILIAM